MKPIALVLTGGESRRFGSPKQIYPWKGKPLLIYIMEKLSFDFDVYTCGKKKFFREENFIEDKLNCGPIGGIYTALTMLRKKVFVLPCDSPNFSLDLAKTLYKNSKRKFFIPSWNNFIEPISGIYTSGLIPYFLKRMNEKNYCLYEFLKMIDGEFLYLRKNDIFFNFNKRND